MADVATGCVRFFAYPTDGLVGKRVGKAELTPFVRQQAQRPAGVALGRRRAGHRDEVRFLLAGQLALCPRAGVLVERPKVFLDKTLPGTSDGGRAYIQRGGHRLVAEAVVGLEQDAGAGELAYPGLAAPQELF
jgi:hypothetical protein